jgi:2-dehydro-3-deoxyphosphogluconate aldolase/(4S)-4-hydroxy-2-oxoglutarate aldolase
MNDKVIKEITKTGIIPIIEIDEPKKTEPLGACLKNEGIGIAEIVLRTENALKAIEAMNNKHPDIIVGAGTILSIDQARAAVKAGAKFIVSPGINKKVAVYCRENHIPVFPGVNTPTHIEAALEMGITTLKFFPAEASGGLEYLKAIAAPYKDIRFIPSGGINEKNIGNYLSHPMVTACGGSWIVKKELIRENNFAEIECLCRKAVQKALALSVTAVGISNKNCEQALSMAALLSQLTTGNTQSTTNIKTVDNDENIIFLGTTRLPLAIAFFEQKGFSLEFADGKNDGRYADFQTKIAAAKIRIIEGQELP